MQFTSLHTPLTRRCKSSCVLSGDSFAQITQQSLYIQAKSASTALQPAQEAVRYLAESAAKSAGEYTQRMSRAADASDLNSSQFSVMACFEIPSSMAFCLRHQQPTAALSFATQALRLVRSQAGSSTQVDKLLQPLIEEVLASLQELSTMLQEQLGCTGTLQSVLSAVSTLREVLRVATALAASLPDHKLWFDSKAEDAVLEDMFLAACSRQLRSLSGVGSARRSLALRRAGDAWSGTAMEACVRHMALFAQQGTPVSASGRSKVSSVVAPAPRLAAWLRQEAAQWRAQLASPLNMQLDTEEVHAALKASITCSDSLAPLGLSDAGAAVHSASSTVLSHALVNLAAAELECLHSIKLAASRHQVALLKSERRVSQSGDEYISCPPVARFAQRVALVRRSWEAQAGAYGQGMYLYVNSCVHRLVSELQRSRQGSHDADWLAAVSDTEAALLQVAQTAGAAPPGHTNAQDGTS